MSFVAGPEGIVATTGGSLAALSEKLAAEVPLERLRVLQQMYRTPPDGTQLFAETYRSFKHGTPWFHSIWYEAYDSTVWDHVYVQGPREHAKTSTVLTYALRRLAKNHHLRIGIVSGGDDLSMKFLEEIKHEFEANQKLRDDFNGGLSWVGDTWTKHELVLADAREGPDGISGKDVSVFAVGRGSQISSRHCDLLIVDDVESAKSVKSDLVRQGTREWWAREVAPVLSPGGKMIVVGTRKHFDDLYAHLITGTIGGDATWHIVDDAKTVYLEDGSPIWPEMWDLNALAGRKAQLDATDVMAWSQEYLNNPRPSETQMFFPERWPTYTKAPWGLSIIQFWDLAISEKTTADFTCGWTIGVDDANNVYLLERRKGHWDFNRTLAEIADMGHFWSGPRASGEFIAIGIEEVAYQAAAVQEALRRTMLPIIPVKPDKDKVVRARLLEARGKPGKVVRPEPPADWWADFVMEATYFPFGAHDDQIDALGGAVRLAGWQSDTIAYAYGIWTCKKCNHMFSWAASRPCPKCSTPAPAEFENPEILSMGEMGSEMTHVAPVRTDPIVLDLEEERLADRIGDGEILDAGTTDEWPAYRASIQNVATWFIETKQAVKAQSALSEVARLDVHHRNGTH